MKKMNGSEQSVIKATDASSRFSQTNLSRLLCSAALIVPTVILALILIFSNQTIIIYLSLILFALLCATGFAVRLAYRRLILCPAREIIEVLKCKQAGDISALVKDSGICEIKQIGQNLNELFKSFEKSSHLLNNFRFALDQHAIVSVSNVKGEITYANDKFCEISQYSRQELLGQDHNIVKSDHHDRDFFKEMWQTIAHGKIWNGEIQNRAKDGSAYWVSTTIVPFLDSNGHPQEYVSIRTDISARKAAEAELEHLLSDTATQGILLKFISSAQQKFITGSDYQQTFNALLDKLLQLCASEYGFIAEVFRDKEGNPYIQTHTVAHFSWDDTTRAHYLKRCQNSSEISELNSLFAATLFTQQPVILNALKSDKSSGKSPLGCPELNTFAALPLFSDGEMVGLVGLVNRVGGYNQEFIANLDPVLATCGTLIHSFRLIREKKSADLELARQKTMLSVFVENVPAAIAMFDLEMCYIAHSHAWCREYMLEDLDLRGKSHYEVFPNISEEWRSYHQRALSGETINKERDSWRPAHWDKDQVLRWKVQPWYSDPDTIGGIIMLTQDITKQVEHEAELVRMRHAAEAATYAKSQFLANMSHEIRTPLASIIGFAEAAREDGVSQEERARALSTILRNGEHLQALINDILDISKIDAGALNIEKVSFCPVALVEQVRTVMIPRVAEKGLSMLINYRWPLPKNITGDSLRLMQVLVNIVSNAIKFTDCGSVELEICCDKSAERFCVSVTDSGIGIYEEQLSGLFQPFSQADHSTTRKYGGTGLGLSISKQLVEKMGGEISVESSVGKGSRFTFYISTGSLKDAEWIYNIPEEQETDASGISKNSISGLNGRVLIADDQPDNRKLLEFTLRKTSLELFFVENGLEVLDAVLSKDFDLILLDMQMPIMDGYTTARTLRNRGVTIPIVAFTANAMKQDLLRCVEAGCTTHLAKPFGKEALFDCLCRQLESSQKIKSQSDTTEIISTKWKEDPDSLELVLNYTVHLIDRISRLKQFYASEDFVSLEREAHSLSGSAGLFGYSTLCESASRLEAAAQRSEAAACRELVKKIEDLHTSILAGAEKMKRSAAGL